MSDVNILLILMAIAAVAGNIWVYWDKAQRNKAQRQP